MLALVKYYVVPSFGREVIGGTLKGSVWIMLCIFAGCVIRVVHEVCAVTGWMGVLPCAQRLRRDDSSAARGGTRCAG